MVWQLRKSVKYKHDKRNLTYSILETFRFYERSIMQDYNFNEYFDRFPLAMAYVPWQHLTQIYEDLDKAYCTGTIFPELTKPFTGRRCVQ